jgi:hypothetical protein
MLSEAYAIADSEEIPPPASALPVLRNGGQLSEE